MKTYFDIPYGEDKAQRLDLYLPDGEGVGTFLFWHGGGFVNGDKQSKYSEAFGKFFTSRGIAFVSPNYRMYPNAKYPDFILDGAAAVAWVKKNISGYGVGEKLYVGGSSAGGYLSMMLCYDEKYLGAHGIDPLEIDAYIHDAGQPTTHFNVLTERGLDRYRCIIDEGAPLYHVGRAKEYSPQLIFVADNDIRARYEQTMLLMATLKSLDYDMSKVKLEYMRGYKHTEYTSKIEPDGDSIFCRKVYDFIKGL